MKPQFSGATTGSVADAVFASLSHWPWVPELRFMSAYHDDPRYIQAVADSIRAHRKAHGGDDKLLISFHGMPKATLMASYDSHHQGCSLQSLHALGLVMNSRIRMKDSFHPVNHVAKADFRSGYMQLPGLLSSCGSGIEKEMVT